MKKYIIPIFIPHYGCSHDCVFCNQNKITGQNTEITRTYVENVIDSHLKNIKLPRDIEIAYYGGSFTALSIQQQTALLMPAYHLVTKKIVNSIRVSTRPDCITIEILRNLISLGVETIELGVQSLDDAVLTASNRGHSSNDVYNAVTLIRKTSLKLVLQIMPGLPGDDFTKIIKTGYKIVRLNPDYVRVYPTIVIENTKLSQLYQQQRYNPLTIGEAVQVCSFLKILFEENNVSIIRMGLQSTTELESDSTVLAGPYHPSFGEMVESYLFQVIINNILEQINMKKRDITIYHNTKDSSKIRGLKKINILYWKNKFRLDNIIFKAIDIEIGFIIIKVDNIKYFSHKKFLRL